MLCNTQLYLALLNSSLLAMYSKQYDNLSLKYVIIAVQATTDARD